MEIFIVQWMERDSWSGPGDSWYTLHASFKDAETYIQKEVAEERARNPSGITPDYYIQRVTDPKTIAVSPRIFEAVKSGKLIQTENINQLEAWEDMKIKDDDIHVLLEAATVEELEKQLEIRKKRLAEEAKPKLVSNPFWAHVIGACEEEMENYASGKGGIKDFEHWLYETVFETLYGPDVWKWINKRT